MATATAENTAADEVSPYRWLILVGLVTASIMEVLDTTIVNVSLPQMAGNLGATAEEIGWVATGYILSNVIVLPMTAWLSGRFGRKRYLTFSILLFIIASFFCGTSHTLGEIVFWRIMQGVGGAALLSTAQATLREIFPRDQQGIVQALFILGIVMAPTLGPTLGGWITDNYTWPWIFFVNVPIGLISVFLVYGFLQNSKHPAPPRAADWPGIGLLAAGLGSLQYVLEEGNRNDWFEDPTITCLAILAGIALVLLVAWELSPTNKNPVVNFRVLKNRDLSASLALFIVLGFGLYGGIFIFPMFAQGILHFTPMQTGLVLLPGGIATGIGVILCGRMLNGPRPLIDPRMLIVFGGMVFTVSMWQLGHLTAQSGETDTRLALIIRGFGLAFLFNPINFVAFTNLKPTEIAQASGLINLTRQLGGSFGIAIIGTYVTNMTRFHRAMLAANLFAGNPAFEQRLQTVARMFTTRGYGLAAARSAALGIIDRTVQTQAMTMSYNNAFLLIGMAVVLASPAVFLLRRPKGALRGGMDAH